MAAANVPAALTSLTAAVAGLPVSTPPALFPAAITSGPPFDVTAAQPRPTDPADGPRKKPKKTTDLPPSPQSTTAAETGSQSAPPPRPTDKPAASPTAPAVAPAVAPGGPSADEPGAVSPALVFGLLISIMVLISVTGVCLHRHRRRRQERKLNEERRLRFLDECDADGLRGSLMRVGNGTGGGISSVAAPRRSGICRQTNPYPYSQWHPSLPSLPVSRQQSWSTATGTATISGHEPEKNDALLPRVAKSAIGPWGPGAPRTCCVPASGLLAAPVAPGVHHHYRSSDSRFSRASVTLPDSDAGGAPPLPAVVYNGKDGCTAVHVYAPEPDPVAATFALPADAIGTWDGQAPPGGCYDEPGTALEGYAEKVFTEADRAEALECVSRAQRRITRPSGAGAARDGETGAFRSASYPVSVPCSPSAAVKFSSSAAPAEHCRGRRRRRLSRRATGANVAGDRRRSAEVSEPRWRRGGGLRQSLPSSWSREEKEGGGSKGSASAVACAAEPDGCGCNAPSYADYECSCSCAGDSETEDDGLTPAASRSGRSGEVDGGHTTPLRSPGVQDPPGVISPMDILGTTFPAGAQPPRPSGGSKQRRSADGRTGPAGAPRESDKASRRKEAGSEPETGKRTGSPSPSSSPSFFSSSTSSSSSRRRRPLRESAGPQEIFFGCPRRTRFLPEEPHLLQAGQTTTAPLSRRSSGSPPSPEQRRSAVPARGELPAASRAPVALGGGWSNAYGEGSQTGGRHLATAIPPPATAVVDGGQPQGRSQRQQQEADNGRMSRNLGILIMLRASDDDNN